MIENRQPDSLSSEPFHADDAEALWAGDDLIPERAAVRGKRILLVEDEKPIRACLRMMLQLEEHQVTEASDGAEALKLFTIGEFDVVITDLQMPVMDGNKLAISIKRLAPSVPIVMITGSARARCDVGNPVDAILNKPFSLSDLRCALKKLLSSQLESAQLTVVPTSESSVAFVPEGTGCYSLAGVTVS